MKSKEARSSFLVPRCVGRSEADMIARGMGRQLELFRETLTPAAKIQVLAMLALSDPKQLDHETYAKIADIARAMGYEQDIKGMFSGGVYEAILDVGLKLRQKSFDVFVRTPAGRRKDGRRKYKEGIVNLSILQEFGRYFEDEDGQPVKAEELPKDQLMVKDDGPRYGVPVLDQNGKASKDTDGNIRWRRANAIGWRFQSRFAELTKDKETAWIFYSNAIAILRQYLSRPVAVNLMMMTLFWKGDGLIEMSHEKLVANLDILAKDQDQVNRAIDAAFRVAYEEGIIDRPVTIRDAGYYKKTKKTGKERRKGKVYQWRRGVRWRVGKGLPMVQAEGQLEAYNEGQNEGKTEKPKE